MFNARAPTAPGARSSVVLRPPRLAAALLLLVALLSSAAPQAVARDNNPYQLITEARLPTLQEQLTRFWMRHAEPGEFAGVDGVPIRYVALRHPQARHAIVLVNGRTESYIKYRELAYDLYRQGYSLYLYDHRGQGFSGRLLGDPQKGHVQAFDDYVQDLKRFHDQVIARDGPPARFLLAHSMGGTVAAGYLARWPDDFRAAALASPMLGIDLGRLPPLLARSIAWLLDGSARLLGRESPYLPGTGPYEALPFADNPLTQSPLRYRLFRDTYRAYPEVQLGGPSARWLEESITRAAQTVAEAGRIRTPLLLLQAGEDSVVRADAQQAFCRHLAAGGHPCAGGQPQRIPGARHELLNESDAFRVPALTAILDFFARHSSPPAKKSFSGSGGRATM